MKKGGLNAIIFVGLLLGFGGVVFGYLEDGGVLASLLKPSSASIVFGGTFGFALIAFPKEYLKQLGKSLKFVFFYPKKDYEALVQAMYQFSDTARKEGLLALESEAEKQTDPFIQKGLMSIVDGVEPEYLKKLLDGEIDAQCRDYERAASVFEGMGGAAPTMGVLGTVMGMVSILRDMGSDMGELGAKIATAFIATMYGVGSANLLWLPLGNHIKLLSEKEREYYELILDGFLLIQSGEYPARVREVMLSRIGEIEAKNKGKGKDAAVSSKEEAGVR